MRLSTATLPVQRTLLVINAVQLGYIAFGYFYGTYVNSFPILEKLFSFEISSVCTTSGCWQSIVPFLGSTYSSIVVLSVLALFFRPGRELRLVLLGIASMHLLMGITRLSVVPSQFYLEGAALGASSFQFLLGILLVISSLLPYSNESSA